MSGCIIHPIARNWEYSICGIITIMHSRSENHNENIFVHTERNGNVDVSYQLFTAYFSNVYMCALWVNYRKTAFHQFKVAYNNSHRILNILPMRCSASSMFASDNVNSGTCVIRRSIYSLMTRIDTSLNPIVKSIVEGDVYCTSALRNIWTSLLYNM